MTLAQLVALGKEKRKPIAWPADLPCSFAARIALKVKPAHILELGTGQGHTGKQFMLALSNESTFTTINWPNPPSGDEVGRELAPWKHDRRLTQIIGDTRDNETVWKAYHPLYMSNLCPSTADARHCPKCESDTSHRPTCPDYRRGWYDMLFIDSGTEHVYSLISEEWRLYESALTDRAIVMLDDIHVNDMMRFWDELPYEKIDTGIQESGFGIFQYVRGK